MKPIAFLSGVMISDPHISTFQRSGKIHPRIPVLALTASATPAIQEDICEKLLLNQPARFIQSFARPNLSYSVFNVGSKINKLVQVLRKVPGSSIVYCKSRKRTAEISETLNGYGIKASYYHAGLSAEERIDRQEKWQKNELPVMVCTNAFGMGIDKPDVRTVVHMDIPDCLESYYQESGRAGRDGKKAYAVLLYAGRDLDDLENQSSTKFPEISTIRKIYQCLVNFFQLPAGAGEDQYFDFDLKEFCQRFKLGTQQVIYSIKALEQEDLLSYAEQIFLPATVQFRVSGEQIFEWEKQLPQSEPLIKILLRTYGGIMDQPTPISEKQIAGGLRTSLDIVKSQLLILHQRGLLAYQPQKERPQIQFIHGRPRAENIGIHSGNYRKRKKAFESRLRTILDFAKDRGRCRQMIIAGYFTGENLTPCGICDNCIDSKKNPLTQSEFTQIAERIFDAIATRPIEIAQLLPLLPDIRKEKTWTVIDLLVEENKVVVDSEGRISPKRKKGQDRNPARF